MLQGQPVRGELFYLSLVASWLILYGLLLAQGRDTAWQYGPRALLPHVPDLLAFPGKVTNTAAGLRVTFLSPSLGRQGGGLLSSLCLSHTEQ